MREPIQPKFTTDFSETFKKMLTPCVLLINGSGPSIVWDEHRGAIPPLDHIDSKILSSFQESEFHSAGTFAQELNVSLSTVHARLTDMLGFSLRHTRWVAQLLTEELNTTRVATSMKMLEILEQQEQIHFAGIVTGDESWFFLEYYRNHGTPHAHHLLVHNGTTG
jgi:hypothetical protein